MRVLVSSTSGYGHVLPMVPLAKALLARGHEVLWTTSADAAALVRAAGVETVDAGLTEIQVAPVRAEIRREAAGLPPEDLAAHVFPRLFGSARTQPMLEALLPVARQWAPDLLVHEQGELAAPLVGTVLGVPHVTHSFGGATPAEHVKEAAERIAPLWDSMGHPMPPYAGCFEHLYLDICPASLQTVSLDHIPRVQLARPVAYADADPVDVSALLPDDDGRPLVYLTLGTVHNNLDVLAAAVRAVAALEVRLLVTVGPDADPAALGPQPAHVRLQRWVPQAAVLPYCAAVVSHGGSGTALAAAAAGLPQVCLPQGADQFRNAAGLVRAGAGVAVHPREASATVIATAVRDVLERPQLRAGAERLRDEIAAMPSPDDVVDRLEELSAAAGRSGAGRARPTPGRP